MVQVDVSDIDGRTWEKVVEKAKKPVAVMFYSPTCAYCRAIEPYFIQYAEEFKDKMVFRKLNILGNEHIVSRYGVMGTPTFKVFCDGRPVQELVGSVYPPLLKKTLEDVLTYGKECVESSSVIDYSISPYA